MGQIARPTPQSPRPRLHMPTPALHPRPHHHCHRRRAPAPRPGLLAGRGVPVLPSQKGSHGGGLGSLPEPSPPHRQLPKAETPVPLGVHHGDWPGERGLAGRDGTGAGQGWGGESQTATGASPAPGPGSLSCLLERAQTWQDTHSSRAPRCHVGVTGRGSILSHCCPARSKKGPRIHSEGRPGLLPLSPHAPCLVTPAPSPEAPSGPLPLSSTGSVTRDCHPAADSQAWLPPSPTILHRGTGQ